MKRNVIVGLMGSAILTALVAGAALATPLVNGATIELRTFNDCPLSTVATTNDYPTTVAISDTMHPECIGFANLHSFTLSADGGATPAVFDNSSSFRVGADLTIAGAGAGEGGLRISPWWAQFVDGRFMLNATTGEIACFGGRLPFYSFTVNHGVTYVKGTTVRMEMEYLPNGLSETDPATIRYRLIQGGTTYDSPLLAFDQANPAEDPPHGLWGILNDARVGGYVQARANTGAALTATWANLTFEQLGTPCADGATIELRTFNDCPISTVTTASAYPDSVSVTDAMNPECIGFANLHSFSFSADGGLTPAVFNNASSFHVGADVRLYGSGSGEGGLRISPWWAKFVDGRFMLNTNSGEIACFGGRLPFYSFTVNHGVRYTKGETVRLEMTYEPNGLSETDPATIQYRLVMGGTSYDSPVLAFDGANPAEDPPYGRWGILNDARVGGYFQALANTGGVLTATWANITFESPDCPCIDVAPPDLTVGLSPDVLWPPNHKMVDVHATVTATDDCDEAPEIELVSVTSNEPDNGKGDGNTSGDIVIVDDHHFQLRAERQGGGDGRVYTVCYRATDAAGHETTSCGTVTVPHDQSGGHASLVIAADRAELVIHGRAGMPARGIRAGSVVLGTEVASRVTISGNPQFTDRDADGSDDAVYRLSQAERTGLDALRGSDAEVLARWSSGSTSYSAPVELSLIGNLGNVERPVSGKIEVSVRPNPAVGTALIRCSLPRETALELSVYDIAGREVGRIAQGVLPAGEHTLQWRPGQSAGPGVYLYRLRTAEGTIQGRFIVIR